MRTAGTSDYSLYRNRIKKASFVGSSADAAARTKEAFLLFWADIAFTPGGISEGNRQDGHQSDRSQRDIPSAAGIMEEAEQGWADTSKQISDRLGHP